jgi:hypothetical protein
MKTFLAVTSVFALSIIGLWALAKHMPDTTPAPTVTHTNNKPTETLETQRVNNETLKACEQLYSTLGFASTEVKGCYEVVGKPVPAKPLVNRYNEELACTVLGYDKCAHYKLCLLEYQWEHKWSQKCEYERIAIKWDLAAAEKAANAEFHEVK